MIDVHRLRVFRAVVASGSVQAAATNLGYTPSAISQHLTALQKETGLALFAKDGRGIAPTPAGRVLAEQSDAVMAQLSRLNGVVDDLREGRTETLTIASFASAGQVWMPQVARGLRDEFPDLQLTVNLNELPGSPAPDGAQLDLRTEDPAGPPTSMPGYTRTLLCEEDYVVAVALDHPLAQRDSTPLADLAVERWISDTSGADICARILRGATQAAGFTPPLRRGDLQSSLVVGVRSCRYRGRGPAPAHRRHPAARRRDRADQRRTTSADRGLRAGRCDHLGSGTASHRPVAHGECGRLTG